MPWTRNNIPKVQMCPMMVYKRWIQGYTNKSAVNLSYRCPQIYRYVNIIIHLPLATVKCGGIENIIVLVWLRTAQYWSQNEYNSNNAETIRLHSNNAIADVKSENFFNEPYCNHCLDIHNPVTHKIYKHSHYILPSLYKIR